MPSKDHKSHNKSQDLDAAKILSAGSAVEKTSVEAKMLSDIHDSNMADNRLDRKLKEKYADWLLAAMLMQLFFISDGMFYFYASKGVHWKIPPGVMSGWLGAT